MGSDNKAVLSVALDRRNKDYFACDAGCLDPPVQLSTIPIKFPVKLTDPVTAVLYITSDYQHMQELKHTIHVKEVVHGKNYYLLKYFHEKIFAIFVVLHLENRKN